jgi:hypothetical protein
MIPDCTLTTSCFDLSKFHEKSRSLEESINNMKALLEIPCYIVIYADSICLPYIKKIRSSYQLDNLTQYIQIEFDELPKYQYLDQVKKNREIYWPTRDERTCAENHILQLSKVDFLLKTIENNPFQTSKFGWIDSSLGPNNLSKICENYNNNMLLYVLNNITDKFHIQILNVCDKKYKDINLKREFYETYRWIMCGSFYTMGSEIGKKIIARINEIAIDTILQGYGHGDEVIFLEILDEFYDDIERSYGDYNNILNNFIRPTRGFEYIYNSIVTNYEIMGYDKECYDCCKTLLREIESYNVEINYHIYFSILFSYYISAYYYKGKYYSRQIVNYIITIMESNPYLKKEYENKKEFYENNFSYAFN